MKSRIILWLMLCAALFLAGCSTEDVTPTGSSLTPSGTQISGIQTGTLFAANSPYWVSGDLIVPAGGSLTIQPGVELRFDDLSGQRYRMLVQGHLSAVGNADNNIIFTSMSAALGAPDRGQWRAIIFDTGTDTSELAFCQIKYGAVWDSTQRYPAGTGLWVNGAIFCWNSSPIIRKCSILVNGYHGIYCIGSQSQPRITDCNIIENDGDGVRCEPLPGQSALATPVIWYSNSQENNARQWADCPEGIGDRLTVNANGDSCDTHFNIVADPMYEDIFLQEYTLHPCSPCISAASDGATMGSIPYYIGLTELRGNIGGKPISPASNPWYVTCNVFVPAGSTLTIPQGTLILFNGAYDMKINGLLQATGATFKPLDSTNVQARWLGLTFGGSANPASYVRNCRFENGSSIPNDTTYTGVITVRTSSLEISGNTFLNSEYVAISCLNMAEPTIQSNVIDGFGVAGINCYNNSHPTIRYNHIRNGVGYGIVCEFTSLPKIESNLIYGTQLWGIKCINDDNDPGHSPTLIRYNTIYGNAYGGIRVIDNSNPIIEANIVAFNYTSTGYNHGCNIQISDSLASERTEVRYNDIYQPPNPALNLFIGFQPDSTNITTDPLFVNAAAGNFHLQPSSPAKTAYPGGPNGGEIGAYGLNPNW